MLKGIHAIKIYHVDCVNVTFSDNEEQIFSVGDECVLHLNRFIIWGKL